MAQFRLGHSVDVAVAEGDVVHSDGIVCTVDVNYVTALLAGDGAR